MATDITVDLASPEQEAEVLEALRNHQALRLRVIGAAEFATTDRQIKRFLRVNDVVHTLLADHVFDETAVPIWEQLSAIGKSAPEGTWDSVPTDLSIRPGLVDECRRQGMVR